MTMHKFPNARTLPEVVGQDRYHIARLSERLDGIIRRGVVTRVRPTGAGFEYTFPAGVDAVYLVDVEIYNPGARPIELQGIESALPVRPGHGVRVLIPGGDVTRGPIVIGRLTPAQADSVLLTHASGMYPSIGWARTWIADVRVDAIQLPTNFVPPPNTPERHYPEAVTWTVNVEIDIPTADGDTYTIRLPVEATLYPFASGGTVTYTGAVQTQRLIEIDDVADLGSVDLTREMPVDNRQVSVDMVSVGIVAQAWFRGNSILEQLIGNTSAATYGGISITLSELGVGTK